MRRIITYSQFAVCFFLSFFPIWPTQQAPLLAMLCYAACGDRTGRERRERREDDGLVTLIPGMCSGGPDKVGGWGSMYVIVDIYCMEGKETLHGQKDVAPRQFTCHIYCKNGQEKVA